MDKKQAFEIVYNELMNINMYRGVHDARWGNGSFMSGIGSVMEKIAYEAGQEEEFCDIFYNNIVESKKKYGIL